MEAKLKEENKLRDKERKDQEERERLKEEEKKRVIEEAAENARQLEKKNLEERERLKEEEERKRLIDEKTENDKQESKPEGNGSNDTDFEDDAVNSLLANIVDPAPQVRSDCSPVDPEAEAADRTLMTAIKHKSWLEARAVKNLIDRGLEIDVPQEVQDLERIFGPGAAQYQLAIEYQGEGEEQPVVSDDSLSDSTEKMDLNDDENSEISDSDQSQVRKTSTPKRRKRGRHKEPGLDSSGSMSPVEGGAADPKESKDKKLRYDEGEKLSEEGIKGSGPIGIQQQVELGDQQHGVHQPEELQLGAPQHGPQQQGELQYGPQKLEEGEHREQLHGEQQCGEQQLGDHLLEEQQQANCDAELEDSSEVTVGEVLLASPGSTEPGGGGGVV